jgi:hypothetical protein
MTKRRHIAVLVTVVILQLFRWLWYSPLLFLSPWLHGLGKEIGQMNTSAALPHVASIAGSIVQCYILAWFAETLNLRTFRQGMGLGAVIGFGFSAPSIIAHYAFIGLSWRVTGVDSLESLVAPALAAGIITAWPGSGKDEPSQD